MNVLSLFDGISCGRLALESADIPVDRYFASEIDKYAIQVSQKNWPDIERLGEVHMVSARDLPKIDLLLAGPPCQGFSLAGKGLNFDDPRSQLFFEAIRIKNETKPKWFLFENVPMKGEVRDRLSELIGVDPVMIDSALVSAQSRKRLYWTNIPVEQPEDRGIVLRDILEPDATTDRLKAYCIDANYYKGASVESYQKKKRRQMVRIGTAEGIKGHDYNRRVYHAGHKSPALNSNGGGNRLPKVAIDGSFWRALTPLECERLQTLPDNYTEGVSNTQRYKTVGNGWTKDVIAHILSGIHDTKYRGLTKS